MIDPNVLNLTEYYLERAKKGKLKYGVDTTRKDLTVFEWLTHLQEELMDATVYIQKLRTEMENVDESERSAS